MGNQVDNKFTWVIKNFPYLPSKTICSDQFIIGGCKWQLMANPRGNSDNNWLSLYLRVADFESLPCGWRRPVEFSFTVVNQLSEKLSVVKFGQYWFDKKNRALGFTCAVPLAAIMVKNGGFLVNGEVKIVAKVEVVEIIGNLDVSEEEATNPLKRIKRDNDDDCAVSYDLSKETPSNLWVDVKGFQVLPSQVDFARRIFERHPEIALGCHTKNQDLRTSYMNVLISLIKMLFKSPQDPSTDDLSDAEATLAYLTNVGFKLDWLEKKLVEVKEVKKKCALVCEMEQELHDLEKKCKDLKAQMDKEKAEILEATTSDLFFKDVV